MSDPYIGEIRLFAGNYAPVNWHFCDGTVLSIADNDALFALIGTTYGGDGITNFRLPDLRGRVAVGQGHGPGLSDRPIGQQYGTESVMLSTAEMPSHSHQFYACAGPASSPVGANNLFAGIGTDKMYIPTPPSNVQLKGMAQETVSHAGSSQPHNNIMPSLGMNYIIALQGIFPTQQ